jgi:hypothetical protein
VQRPITQDAAALLNEHRVPQEPQLFTSLVVSPHDITSGVVGTSDVAKTSGAPGMSGSVGVSPTTATSGAAGVSSGADTSTEVDLSAGGMRRSSSGPLSWFGSVSSTTPSTTRSITGTSFVGVEGIGGAVKAQPASTTPESKHQVGIHRFMDFTTSLEGDGKCRNAAASACRR